MAGKKLTQTDAEYGDVRAGIVDLLQKARTISVRSLNAVMTATYWEIGRRIVEREMSGLRHTSCLTLHSSGDARDQANRSFF